MNNCNNWFYLCLALLGLILILVAMFMGYNLKLDKRTVKLEKKNGKELREIAELRKEIAEVKAKQKHDHMTERTCNDTNDKYEQR